MYASHAFGHHLLRTMQPRKERKWKGPYIYRIALLCMVTLASALPSFLYEYCRNHYNTDSTTYQKNSIPFKISIPAADSNDTNSINLSPRLRAERRKEGPLYLKKGRLRTCGVPLTKDTDRNFVTRRRTSLRDVAEQQRESGERRSAIIPFSRRKSSRQEMLGQNDGKRFLILEGKKRNKSGPGFVVVPIALMILIGIHLRMKKVNKRGENLPSSEATEEIECAKHLQFDFSAIRLSTNNFSEENKIGQSMVGLVYRGRLRDGRNISVKRFNEHDSCRQQFKNEIKLSPKFQHRNIVKLLGFCLEGSEMLLVYEFVSMSLDLLIFDPLKFKHNYLGWGRRSNIIRGIARGLLYLHEDSGLKIVHCDITAGNVLLDEELNPKILGFGRAKVFGEVDKNEDASVSQHASTSLTGYGAPEFFQGGVISEKADVFSFGVLVLEIVTGQRSCEPLCHGNPDGEPTLISTVWRNWIEGTAFKLVDPQIKDGEESEIMRCIHIGLLCVQENKDARPTMNSVVLMLCCDSFPLPVPSQPGYFSEISRNELNDDAGASASSSDNFVTRLEKKLLRCFAAKGGKSMS